MCIAIVAPATVRVPERYLIESARHNKDGCGIAYITDGKIAIAKNLMTPEKFAEVYDKLFNKFGDNPMLLHCRIATAGKVTSENCHPFQLNSGALIHNGMLWSGSLADEKSDTRQFVEENRKYLVKDFVRSNIDKIENVVGYNKIAMLWADGSYDIVNKRMWHEEEGVMYSNRTYVPVDETASSRMSRSYSSGPLYRLPGEDNDDYADRLAASYGIN